MNTNYKFNFTSNLQPSWVTDEEFGMGYLETKPSTSLTAKPSVGNLVPIQSGSGTNVFQSEPVGVKTNFPDSINSAKEQMLKTKAVDGRLERSESVSNPKSDPGNLKVKSGLLVNGSEAQSPMPLSTMQSGLSRSTENQKQVDESSNRSSEEGITRVAPKNSSESEVLFWSCFF